MSARYTDIIGHFALGIVLIHVIKLFIIGEEVKEGDIRIGSYGQAWRGVVEIYTYLVSGVLCITMGQVLKKLLGLFVSSLAITLTVYDANQHNNEMHLN